jgi:primosomal protein N' (replication factor Y)
VFIRVAVPVPQLDLLTYRVPDGTEAPAVGARVIVPLGSRLVTGIIVDSVDEAAEDGQPIKALQRVLDDEAFVPADVVALASWTADYYAAGVGATITAVLPPKTRGSRADAHKTRRVAAITEAGQAVVDPAPVDPVRTGGRAHKRVSGRANEALRLLAASPKGLSTSMLAASGVSSNTLSRLASRGLIALRQDRVPRDPFDVSADRIAVTSSDGDRVLTDEQRRALARLRALVEDGAFHVALLHGVTGSGKTEIYLRLALATRASGRGVLMLVPEIALTPAIALAFRGAFGDRVAIQHSGLSDGERHDQWQRIRRHEIDVVVGTRSAVFAPLANPGLIVIDEEHDGSYKQEESPRYNARDVAIVRAHKANALVLLGSATPSMESYHHAMQGKYEHVVLEQRVLDRPLASVTVVDMRGEYAVDGPDVVLSRPLKTAIHERLERGEQSLVLLNRRGFATAVFCRQCAGTIECPNCSVSLVVHGEGRMRRARCHYCNLSMPVPATCPTCAAPYLEQSGFGTQRVEAEVARCSPGARVARLDRDAIRRKGALVSLLARFRAGEIDVLIGTQMIAKGHDFPRVTLVGVVSADVGLGLADFRASERTFQLLTQVAGRAGRGEQPGEAIVQTLYPDHYSIQLACRQDYPGFYARELQFRRAMRYPPLLSLINVIVRATSMAGAMQDAKDLAASISRDGARVLGPAPAPIARLRGQYRAQMLIKGTSRRQMRDAVLRAIAERPRLARRATIDVDPLNVL